MGTPDSLCPCGSQRSYGDCCQPCHEGKPAAMPEALMRSRYSAFALQKAEYLRATWHPRTRPAALELAGTPKWTSLQILDTGQAGDKGQVHFRAIYRSGNGWGYLEERSDFLREDGRWYYLSGDTTEGSLKPGRNDRCPCGSGRKFKACCQ